MKKIIPKLAALLLTICLAVFLSVSVQRSTVADSKQQAVISQNQEQLAPVVQMPALQIKEAPPDGAAIVSTTDVTTTAHTELAATGDCTAFRAPPLSDSQVAIFGAADTASQNGPAGFATTSNPKTLQQTQLGRLGRTPSIVRRI